MGLAQPRIEPVYTEEEYLALEREADERHEYIDGMIYAMAGESPEHGKVSVNLIRIVSTHLLDRDCDLFTKDMKVRSGPLPKSRLSTKGLYSYPDLVVICGEMKFLDEYQDVLINPTAIIEVLSDSTEEFDHKQKFPRYQQCLPTLADYLLVSQNQPLIELFHRPSPRSARWEYLPVSGLTGRLTIPSIKCPLQLVDVYRRVKFPVASGEGKRAAKNAPGRRPALRQSAKIGRKK
jgi:Uma2 family endonuclease